MTDAGRRTSAASAAVGDRYGTKRSRRLDRRIGWVVASVAVAAGLVFLSFGTWLENTIEFKNIGFTLAKDDDGSGVYGATTRFEVTHEPGARVSCAVEALNTSKATVGWKVVDLPVQDGRTQTASVDLVTIGPATAAHVKTCWELED